MGDGLSIRAYAKLRKARGMDGGTPSAVHKALGDGRIRRNRHGNIDPDQADRDWAANTRSIARLDERPVATPAKPPAPSRPAVQRDQVPDDAAGYLSDQDQDEASLAYHRARSERAKADRAELTLAREAGKLVNADDAVRAFAEQIAAAKSLIRSRSRTIVEELCRVGGVPKTKLAAVSEALQRSDESILRELAGVEPRDADSES